MEIIGYLLEFHPDKEIKECVSVDDLTSTDKEKQDLVQSWIVGLAEPWCESAVGYCININQGRDVPADDAHKWVAECRSIFYDCLESVLIGYGATPTEALANVQNKFDEMMVIYHERYENNIES